MLASLSLFGIVSALAGIIALHVNRVGVTRCERCQSDHTGYARCPYCG